MPSFRAILSGAAHQRVDIHVAGQEHPEAAVPAAVGGRQCGTSWILGTRAPASSAELLLSFTAPPSSPDHLAAVCPQRPPRSPRLPAHVPCALAALPPPPAPRPARRLGERPGQRRIGHSQVFPVQSHRLKLPQLGQTARVAAAGRCRPPVQHPRARVPVVGVPRHAASVECVHLQG